MFRYWIAFFVVFSFSCAADFPKEKGLYAWIQTSEGDMIVRLFEKKAPLTVSNFVGLAEGTKAWIHPKTRKEVRKRFYKGLTFHRVIQDFMIQGGCPIGNGTGGPGYQFEDECYEKIEVTGQVEDASKASAVWTDLFAPYVKTHSPNGPSKIMNDLYQKVIEEKSFKPLFGRDISFYLKESGLKKKKIYGRGDLIHKIEYGTICMANSGPNTNGSQFFIVTKKDGCSWLNGKHTVFGKVVSGVKVMHAIESAKTDSRDKPAQSMAIKDIVIKRI